MRVKSDEIEIIASVDTWTGYPSDENTARMLTLISFVEDSPHKVVVCAAYPSVKKYIGKGSFACRAGYHFRFWFDDEESADEFAKLTEGLLEVPPVLSSDTH